MSSPQKENGYTPIANELLEAMYKTNFTATEFKTILLIMRYTFGFSRKEHQVSLTFISKGIGISKRYVSSAVGKLINDNILLVVKEHTDTQGRIVKLNKDYDKWENRDSVQQMNHSSTVEAEINTTDELQFNTTDELQFTQDKQNIKQNKNNGACNSFFEQIWQLYPNKKGKAQVNTKSKKELQRLGIDVVKTCIDRYVVDKPDWKQFQNGSTFFNGGYIDYIDESFTEQASPLEDERSEPKRQQLTKQQLEALSQL